MEKTLTDLFAVLAGQIPFALLIYIVMERQQSRADQTSIKMLEAVNLQNLLYQKISESLDEIKTHLYIKTNPKVRKMRNDLSSE
jgi:hypothetical protein